MPRWIHGDSNIVHWRSPPVAQKNRVPLCYMFLRLGPVPESECLLGGLFWGHQAGAGAASGRQCGQDHQRGQAAGEGHPGEVDPV